MCVCVCVCVCSCDDWEFIQKHFFLLFSPSNVGLVLLHHFPHELNVSVEGFQFQRSEAKSEKSLVRCGVITFVVRASLRRAKRGAILKEDERNERAKQNGWVSLVVDVAVCSNFSRT